MLNLLPPGLDRRRTRSSVRSDRVEAPTTGNALELVRAALGEGEPGAGHHLLDSARHPRFARCRSRLHPSTDVQPDASTVEHDDGGERCQAGEELVVGRVLLDGAMGMNWLGT